MQSPADEPLLQDDVPYKTPSQDLAAWEKTYDYARTPRTTSVNILPRLLLLCTCTFVSLFGIICLVRTIPYLSLPTSLEQVKSLALLLEDYSNDSWGGYVHILSVIAVIYVWKQSFSVPGAIFLNILAGALYGPITATLLTSFLTAVGASGAYFIGKYIGQPMLDQYLADKLVFLRRQVDENRDNLFYYALFIRLFPLSPWWLLNLASPLLYIPLTTFFASMFFGSIPYNLACCQAGDILQELQSTADIWRPALLLKMLLVSVLSLVPPLLTKRIKKWAREKPKEKEMETEMEMGEVADSHMMGEESKGHLLIIC